LKLIDGAANTTEYFYCHEQLTGDKFPDGSTRAAGFDNLNRQIWAVDERGVAVSNAYDKLDRVIASYYVPFTGMNDMPDDVTTIPSGLTIPTCDTSIIYNGFNNQNITYAYDKVGNVTNMTDWAVTITNAYDSLNRWTCEFTQDKTNPYDLYHTFYSEYDLLNNRTGMYVSADNDYIANEFRYDVLNRLSVLKCRRLGKTIHISNTYNPNGKIANTSVTENGLGSLTCRSYDSEQRLSAIVGKYYSTDKVNLSYTYNNAQQITAISETIDGAQKNYSYNYDNRDQITSENSGTLISYSYDLAQNRLTKDNSYGYIDSYSYVIANKLTNIVIGSSNANNQYFYDIAGNLTSNKINSTISKYYYNAQNKLAKITGPDFVYKFLYDSQNRRIGIARGPNENSLTWRYTIHNGNVPIGETDSSGDVNRWFVRGVGIAEGTGDMLAEIIGSDSSAKVIYYLSNHRGDTLLALRDNYPNSPIIVAKYRYDAFGNPAAGSGAWMVYESENAPRFTFSTKKYLSDIESYLYAYRIYESPSGRWTQRDPIDYQDSVNLYQFCGNNPVNSFDLYGLESVAVYHGDDKTESWWQADGDDFKKEANAFYDYAIDASDINEANIKVGELKKEGVEINELTIIDHGKPGAQQLGDEYIDPNSDEWKKLSSLVEKDGLITLDGCEVSKGNKGQKYIKELEEKSGRKIDASSWSTISWGRFLSID